MTYPKHVRKEAAHRCAICLDKPPKSVINLCHIIPRSERLDNLRMLERAWRIPANTFSHDTRWNQIYLCSNWHADFDHGGWSFLPSGTVLSKILEGFSPGQTETSYDYWLKSVEKLRKKGKPPVYFFQPLLFLGDNKPIIRYGPPDPDSQESALMTYQAIQPPYEEVTSSLPIHPFPVIAHFMKNWQKLTRGQQTAISASIWEIWVDRSPDIAIPEMWGDDDNDDDCGDGGDDGDDDDEGANGDGDGDGTGSEGGDCETADRETRNGAKSREGGGHGASEDLPLAVGTLHQSTNLVLMLAGRTLVDSRTGDKIPRKMKAIAASPLRMRAGMEMSSPMTESDCSCCPPSEDLEESEDEDYNPLPDYAPHTQADIPSWAAGIEDGDDSLREHDQLPAVQRSLPKRDRTLVAYSQEKSRSPPHDPDWTKWEADTSGKWERALRPLKRRKIAK
ncbi:hypothetical protein PUNSTDRAFT_145973 [Punctularia strigosozonata HHB-11173 SS5]|uniref:uncharacterized protein n=1 Tax=Punctularia strigosozonata (strain HHB-11173) TaxID=741275 RepID=UPI0004417480|nr:uncharacterized protein PUNSTDRAFT_145973 [Punctularia strigosozonata HHB-11173 SS5]EIN05613.1 hypothetical protein PUNSTDRAFT_145973 [Punctularia strigosozonata HHB-11173 SS5]